MWAQVAAGRLSLHVLCKATLDLPTLQSLTPHRLL